jgi:hypothetical protein
MLDKWDAMSADGTHNARLFARSDAAILSRIVRAAVERPWLGPVDERGRRWCRNCDPQHCCNGRGPTIIHTESCDMRPIDAALDAAEAEVSQ